MALTTATTSIQRSSNVTSINSFCEAACMFVGDALPRQVYLNLLLRLLAIYFARYALFEDAEAEWVAQCGEWAGVFSGERHYYPPAPLTYQEHSITGMDFEPVLATTLTNSSDPEVEAVGQVGQIVNTAKGSRPIMAREQRRTSGASPEFSTKVRPSDSDKFSAPPASPIYTTGTITSTGLTNFGITTICAKHGSFSANNSNSQSSLNTPLNLNHAVGDGSLNTETNSMSVADGGMPRGVSSDTTGGSGSLTTTQSVGQVFFRLQARGSNPMPSSPAPGTSDCHDPNPNPQTGPNTNINLPFRFPPPSHSPSRSRTASFLPEEWRHPSSFSPLDVDLETGAGPGLDAISGPGTSPSPSFNSSSNGSYNPNLKFINVTSIKSFCEAARLFLSNTLPRLVYHNFLLLRFPAMYSSRAAMYSLRAARMVELDLNSQGGGGAGVNSANGAPFHGGSGRWVSGFSGHQGTSGVLGAAANGFDYWEAFINSLLKEWKTLNLVSALLIPTLLAILQIPEAADDLITRSTALLSLICALMSLSYGCIYIVRFGTMRRSKEDKYCDMVECLDVTGDAGGVDGLVIFTFTLLADPRPHAFFLSPQVNALLHYIHPLIHLAYRIRQRSFLPCTVKRNSSFGYTGGYHGGVGAWVGVFGDDTEYVDEGMG
ncbi:uncharacterized protein LACBIDRAFT_331715 [Laccaria bicolor S238N-H82]|uniref:Predicted protein n=1 Tax=Laccaria bicolor (strain S238N-H82 / ATCC MYA-4686) TaxID=486041 RepID=B0DQC2_LACBS|nr:uncharacterized protein LACBIDRAFT_331715 [Laccaria bicolor S238N-H82]EDR03357.1 predicted protein [Laccaria bicolor S238N-H82]|eukprot:XP_001886153.1 predicted protein [Laccaria bicolor S238N-H82]